MIYLIGLERFINQLLDLKELMLYWHVSVFRCHTEVGLLYNVWTTVSTADTLTKMINVSPIRYADKVCAVHVLKC